MVGMKRKEKKKELIKCFFPRNVAFNGLSTDRDGSEDNCSHNSCTNACPGVIEASHHKRSARCSFAN